jgi:glycosyltransferase involved in cell wall biosynthesis
MRADASPYPPCPGPLTDMADSNAVPLISIALCTFNGQAYLAEQLASLTRQTWSRLEIIAVDDHSSDATLPMLHAAAAQDARIRVYRNDSNLGFAASFCKALSLCRGELIAPCDQDDVWHEDKLTRLQLRLGGHLMVYCDSELIDQQGVPLNQRISERLAMYEGSDPRAFTFWNCISGHAMLFPARLLQRALPMPAVRFHDWWLAFVAAGTGSIAYVEEPLVRYRQHGRSQTDVARRKKETRDTQRQYRQRADWLAALAGFDSPHQPFFETLSRLWSARAEQWICPALVRLLLRNGEALLRINRRESARRFALKQGIGMKPKLLFTARP